jgi:hypothetical protein
MTKEKNKSKPNNKKAPAKNLKEKRAEKSAKRDEKSKESKLSYLK